jgi:hypothetical protein
LKEYDKALADTDTYRKLGGQPSAELLKSLSQGARQPQ